ncbi:MAG: amino acid ABC transporter permease [Geminicoccaceae bacterium]|nr:amino acid ABC transporter permease [Geminicoccaceae bacterium]MDW8340263.1 amino acid ABC transporter permease [Geminicoccaceae bacterium]
MASATVPRPVRVPLWRDRRVRAWLAQALVLGLVIAGAAYLVHNTIVNRERLGVASGFDFLFRLAGFDVSQALIDFGAERSSYGRAFLVGLLNTLYVAAVGIVLTTVIGFVMGIARLSSNWLVAKLALVYIEVIRNVPLLLQLIFWYVVVLGALPGPRESLVVFGVGYLNVRGLFLPKPIFEGGLLVELVALLLAVVGVVVLARWAKRRRDRTGKPFPTFWVGLAILLGAPIAAHLAFGGPIGFEYPRLTRFRLEGGLVLLPEFLAIVLGLSVYTGAFLAEIVRSGILSVSKGQLEAAAALGLRRPQILRLVVIPQALRVIIPPQTSQYLNLTKNSSLGVAIGYPDFFNVAGTINNQTGQAVEVIAITMAVYLSFSLAISAFMNWYNAKMALVER